MKAINNDFEELKAIPPLINESIGFLVDENKERLLLAFTYFGNDVIKHAQYIPKGMILDIIFLTEEKK